MYCVLCTVYQQQQQQQQQCPTIYTKEGGWLWASWVCQSCVLYLDDEMVWLFVRLYHLLFDATGDHFTYFELPRQKREKLDIYMNKAGTLDFLDTVVTYLSAYSHKISHSHWCHVVIKLPAALLTHGCIQQFVAWLQSTLMWKHFYHCIYAVIEICFYLGGDTADGFDKHTHRGAAVGRSADDYKANW